MSTHKHTAQALAAALLAGQLEADEMVERASQLFAKRYRWLRPLARRVEAAFGEKLRPRTIAVAKFLQSDEGFQTAVATYDLQPVHRWWSRPRCIPSRLPAAGKCRRPPRCASWPNG